MSIIYTPAKARLTLIRSDGQKENWLFLPGGPGLGSESLKELTDIIDLPGALWFLDLPGDGSNHVGDFSNWQQALIEASEEFDSTILVAHSSGGMFALATPALEKNLKGLILMDSAPNKNWQDYFQEYVKKHPVSEVDLLQADYDINPSNELLKDLTIASLPYFAFEKNIDKMTDLLQSLPINYQSHQWATKHFHPFYSAQWVPQTMPTLIFSGDQDHITPLSLFSNAPEFHQDNIVIQEIKQASHFPWFDNPEEIKRLFLEYTPKL